MYQILKTMRELNINCRVIETKSIVDKNIENGCLITFGEQYNSKKNVRKTYPSKKIMPCLFITYVCLTIYAPRLTTSFVTAGAARLA